MKTTAAAALTLVMALLGTACSTTEQPAEPGNVAVDVPSAPTPAEPIEAAAPSPTSTAAPTPDEQVLSAADASRAAAEANRGRQFGGEEFGLSQQQLVERSEAVEARIGECMAAAGFEYFPVDFATIRRAMSSDKSAPGLSDSQFVEQYGFGITTQFDKPIVQIGISEQNQRVLDNLGPADQVAYMRTLLGDNSDATYAFGLETEDFSRTGGCTREAIAANFAPEEMSASYFNPGDALIETDPRAVQAIADWSACMADGGHDSYLHPNDVEADFQRRLDALTKGADAAELAGAQLAALTDLQAEERAVAAVFTDCEANVLDPAMHQVESDFYGR